MAIAHLKDDRTSEAERAVRRDLAACYRLAALHGWDDLVATHISARVPGEEAFLINPFGLLFEEVTASSLVKLDLDGNVLAPTEHEVNQAGFVVHSAVHEARPDAGCVMHLHTRDGVAVSALEEGLLPITQTSMLLNGAIGYHDYEGVAIELGERERLARDLGDHDVMFLRNHGTLAVGPSVGECFVRMYYLEWACAVQVRTLSMGRPLRDVSAEIAAKVRGTRNKNGSRITRDLTWPALLRKVDRHLPGYA